MMVRTHQETERNSQHGHKYMRQVTKIRAFVLMSLLDSLTSIIPSKCYASMIGFCQVLSRNWVANLSQHFFGAFQKKQRHSFLGVVTL